jgi:hypothetical protein
MAGENCIKQKNSRKSIKELYIEREVNRQVLLYCHPFGEIVESQKEANKTFNTKNKK